MRVTLFSCGPAANESELKASKHLENCLKSTPGNDEWVLLTNLAFSVTHQLQSDEIDIIAIGPPGVRVIEVKHWTAQWVDENPDRVAQEADRVTNKARKIGTTLRKIVPALSRVDGVILVTQEPSKTKKLAGKNERGVTFFSINDWKGPVGFDCPITLTVQQVRLLSRALEPKIGIAIDGSLRRLAGYVNLELQTPKEERFHRAYKGSHSVRQDRVVLHLYDLSATDEKNADARAQREYEALRRLQLHAWAPRILDSFQSAPGYAGEMSFFTLVDPEAPSLDDRTADSSWGTTARLGFARSAVQALKEMHATGAGHEQLFHRNLTPKTILVKYDNSPIFTGFDRTKIPSDISVTSIGMPTGDWESTFAPEVRAHGFGTADARSDVYSLSACLATLFHGRDDPESWRALGVIAVGMAEDPSARSTLQNLEVRLGEILGESAPPPPPLPARFWTEDQVIPFRDRYYRIVTHLGSGGVGKIFKVVEIDRSTKEDLGTYVAKVGHSAESGQRVLKSYSLARSHLGRNAGLSAIFEVAREWLENGFIALMTWIEGTPLREFIGVFPLLAEEQQEISGEALALRWLRTTCNALDVLHRNGLVHGDISPRNMIVSGNDIVLTDYDFVGKIGEPLMAPGTMLYCSTAWEDHQPASPSDDIYALGASFFHVVFEKEPFQYAGVQAKDRGLNWEGTSRDESPDLTCFLDRATHPDPGQRFRSVADALALLRSFEQPPQSEERPAIAAVTAAGSGNAADPGILREEKVDWLLSLLQSYPGSLTGNQETRGLDSPFAADTYVPTSLDESLYDDIVERQARLVILCGNAGDGKTALLQHLADRLGLGRHSSSERVLEGKRADGLVVRMNLDGSASWRGRSADELLDEFLKPFERGAPDQDIVHLLAINDGRLLEWIERSDTQLTNELYDLLENRVGEQQSHIRFINLNERSLVGGITLEQKIGTEFLDHLLDHLYGGERAAEIWAPCQTCSAQDRCEVFRAARVFGPGQLRRTASTDVRARARERLFEALQAVHLRGETHVTVRELRGALVYILFGIHFCADYHGETDVPKLAYWDRAFSPSSPARQGEVLPELARFDPGLEAHPQIDRYLLNQPAPDSQRTAPHYAHYSVQSARRRAFFEWTEEHIKQIAGDKNALDLARGRHLRLFRSLACENEQSKLADICEALCRGISQLEDIPPKALDRRGVVPLRIAPRTPTDTTFWVEKPLSAFRLEADVPPSAGMDRLHRQAWLIYRYRDGREERLPLGAELFHLLLELSDGYQLGDVSTDDTFAHLSIFVQRLLWEDERQMLAWSPMNDETVYRVSAELETGDDGVVVQTLVLNTDNAGRP